MKDIKPINNKIIKGIELDWIDIIKMFEASPILRDKIINIYRDYYQLKNSIRAYDNRCMPNLPNEEKRIKYDRERRIK